MYSITDAGNAYLDFWARSLEQYQRNMDTFFRLYTGGRRPARLEQQKKTSSREANACVLEVPLRLTDALMCI